MDLQYQVEDALKWDKYSNKTRNLVDKFKDELIKNYTDPKEATGVERDFNKPKRNQVRLNS